MKLTMFLLPVLFATLISCTKSELSSGTSEGSGAGAASVNKTVLLDLVNEARKKGCQCGDTYYNPAPPLTWNDKLEAAALAHTKDMFQNNYFSHTAPDGSNAGVRIEKAGYAWKAYGENIAYGHKNEQDVVKGWLQSPGHCKNIMSRYYKEMGVARTGSYWAQEFGAK